MKNFIISIWVLLALTVSLSHAVSIDPPLPLEKRVGMSTHVFVGEIQEINCVNETGEIITEEEAIASYPHLTARWKIKVHEVLFPTKWRAGGIAELQRPIFLWHPYADTKEKRIAHAETTLTSYRKIDIGKKYIFLTRAINPNKKKVYLISAQDQYYHEDLKQKAKIQSIIKNALAKKKSKKSPKKTTTTR